MNKKDVLGTVTISIISGLILMFIVIGSLRCCKDKKLKLEKVETNKTLALEKLEGDVESIKQTINKSIKREDILMCPTCGNIVFKKRYYFFDCANRLSLHDMGDDPFIIPYDCIDHFWVCEDCYKKGLSHVAKKYCEGYLFKKK